MSVNIGDWIEHKPFSEAVSRVDIVRHVHPSDERPGRLYIITKSGRMLYDDDIIESRPPQGDARETG